MSKVFTIACLLQVILTSAFALDPQIIVNQSEAPIEIEEFKGEYAQYGSNEVNITKEVTTLLETDIRYKNISNKTIVAARIVVVSFDIWDEYLTSSYLLFLDSVKPGKSKKKNNFSQSYFPFLFAAAYIDRVRFDDGTFWYHDKAVVLQALEKIEKDFDFSKHISNLEGNK